MDSTTTPVRLGSADSIRLESLNLEYDDKIHSPPHSTLSNLSVDSGMSEDSTSSTLGSLEGGHYKRSAERITVEGSPMNLLYKKVDQHKTPATFKRFFEKANIQYGNKTQSKFNAMMSQSASDSNQQCNETSCDRNSPVMSKKIYVLSSGSSSSHHTGEHQENAKRTSLICAEEVPTSEESAGVPAGCLRRPLVTPHVCWIPAGKVDVESGTEDSSASLADLMRVHDYAYLSHLQKRCKVDSGDVNAAPFSAPAGMLDSDTPLVNESFQASRDFCGAAIKAVDLIMRSLTYHAKEHDTITKALVVGRPPGHHAGPSGCVASSSFWRRPDMTSNGFCLLNTVAVAAAYARYMYGTKGPPPAHNASKHYPKIAIVDIDVHHGNGTEEIVRNLRPHTTYLPLPSSWAPMSRESYKPWLHEHDAEDTLLSSIHLYAEERFYPGSGEDNDEMCGDGGIINIGLTPIGPGPWDAKGRAKLANGMKADYEKLASQELRSKVSRMLLPRLAKFQPDLLFISAGFDAHTDDMYHFLNETDFHWLTSALTRASNGLVGDADVCGESSSATTGALNQDTKDSQDKNGAANSGTSDGDSGAGAGVSGQCQRRPVGVISVLEGGYSLSSPTPAVTISRSSSLNTRNKQGKKASAAAAPVVAPKYGIVPGDGGLVKGILAHTAAMCGIDDFLDHAAPLPAV